MVNYSANTCDILTLYPLGVECIVTDAYSPFTTDGAITLFISGGTPPYKTVWWSGVNNKYGNVSRVVDNLPAGSYTAITTDFWYDYTAITVCTLIDPTPT